MVFFTPTNCESSLRIVGDCGSEELLNHYFQFGKRIVWDNRVLLHIEIDGPNVNLKFQENLREATGQKFLDIDTCTLHKVRTSFKRGMTVLPIDIDQFTVDLHGFFQLSSARREDYSSMEELTYITSKYLLRHSSVRWLTLEYVLSR